MPTKFPKNTLLVGEMLRTPYIISVVRIHSFDMEITMNILASRKIETPFTTKLVIKNNSILLKNKMLDILEFIDVLKPSTFFKENNGEFYPVNELIELVNIPYMARLIKAWEPKYKKQNDINYYFYYLLKRNYISYIREIKIRKLLG